MNDATHGEEGAGSPLKQDPETLVLRGSPRRVVRFKRGLIIGITGLVAACLATVTWFALEPLSFRLATGQEGEGGPLRKAAPDALANAPSSYGEVPRLGPPLPGDLGRPILEHQRSLAEEPGPIPPGRPIPQADPALAAAQAERQRLAATREAARSSAVIVQLAGRGGSAAQPAPAQTESPRTPAAATPAPAGGGAQQCRFDLASSDSGATSPQRLQPAPSPWMLSAGTIIPASLVTGLNSDLPGTVIAQVTENVRDSATGRTVLIPQGARLIGKYDNVIAYGQRRALLIWQRIILPDGSSLSLDNMPAADLSGYAGVEDRVDFHTWRLLKGIALSTLLGVGTEITWGSGESDLVRALRESAQQNAARAGDQTTQRNLDVHPTIRVRPGWPLRAIIHKDLVLRPWGV